MRSTKFRALTSFIWRGLREGGEPLQLEILEIMLRAMFNSFGGEGVNPLQKVSMQWNRMGFGESGPREIGLVVSGMKSGWRIH